MEISIDCSGELSSHNPSDLIELYSGSEILLSSSSKYSSKLVFSLSSRSKRESSMSLSGGRGDWFVVAEISSKEIQSSSSLDKKRSLSEDSGDEPWSSLFMA